MRHTTSLIHQRLSTTGTVLLVACPYLRNLDNLNVPPVKAGKVGLKQSKKFLNGLGIDAEMVTPTLSRK